MEAFNAEDLSRIVSESGNQEQLENHRKKELWKHYGRGTAILTAFNTIIFGGQYLAGSGTVIEPVFILGMCLQIPMFVGICANPYHKTRFYQELDYNHPTHELPPAPVQPG